MEATRFQDKHGHSFYIPRDVIQQEQSNPFLKNLVVTKLGFYERAAQHGIFRPACSEHILILCMAGRGEAQWAGQTLPVTSGDLVVLAPGAPHRYQADPQDPWTIHWAHLVGEGLAELLHLAGIGPRRFVVPLKDPGEGVQFMESALQTLRAGYSTPQLLYASALLQSFLSSISGGILRPGFPGTTPSSASGPVEVVLTHMLEQVDASLTLDDFAGEAAMSRYHFSRVFREQTGYSPMAYFTRLKITRACDLLDTSSLTIRDISEQLSFDNPRYFSQVFRRITGMSPRQYRSLKLPLDSWAPDVRDNSCRRLTY